MGDTGIKLAAAQTSPVYHDKKATIDKACQWIQTAGEENVDVIVFPETFIPGYPYWRGCSDLDRWNELMVELQNNSVDLDGDEIPLLEKASEEANTAVIIGATELSSKKGSETLYNSLLFFDPDSGFLGSRRKLMPTHHERSIWGRGDGEGITSFASSVGELSGAVCYENHMSLLKSALSTTGEEIHAAVWPGFWEQHGNPCDRSRAESQEAKLSCDIYACVRQYAFENQTFVISSSPYMETPIEGYPEISNFNMAAGGSMIVNPAGIVKEGPLINEEKLLTATVDMQERNETKAYFDSVGHYTRPDIFDLSIKR